jgi:GNAT superfamily N-acetyltransferase
MITNIRRATLEDAEPIFDLAARFIADTSYRKYLDYDLEVLENTLEQILRIGVVFVVEREGRLVGLLAGAALPSITGRGTFADEVVWYVEPEARKGSAGPRMLGSFLEWARAKGCNSCKMVAPAGSSVGKFLERRGFEPVETAYVLRL